MPIAAANFANFTFGPTLPDGTANPLTGEQKKAFITDLLDNPADIRGVLFRHSEQLAGIHGLEELADMPDPAVNAAGAQALIPNANLIAIADDILNKASNSIHRGTLNRLLTATNTSLLLALGNAIPGRNAYLASIIPYMGAQPAPRLIEEVIDDQLTEIKYAAANRVFELIKTNIANKTVLDAGINSFDVADMDRDEITAPLLAHPDLFGFPGLEDTNIQLFSDEQLEELGRIGFQKRNEIILRNSVADINDPNHPIFAAVAALPPGNFALARTTIHDSLGLTYELTDALISDANITNVLNAVGSTKAALETSASLQEKIKTADVATITPIIDARNGTALKIALKALAAGNPTDASIDSLLTPQLRTLRNFAKSQRITNDVLEGLRFLPDNVSDDVLDSLTNGIDVTTAAGLDTLRNNIANADTRRALRIGATTAGAVRGLSDEQITAIFDAAKNQLLVNQITDQIDHIRDNQLLGRLLPGPGEDPLRIKNTIQSNKATFGLHGADADETNRLSESINKLSNENLNDIRYYMTTQLTYNNVIKQFKYNPDATPEYYNALSRFNTVDIVGVKASLKANKETLFHIGAATPDTIFDPLSDKQLQNIRKLAFVRQAISQITDPNQDGLQALRKARSADEVREAIIDHFPDIAAVSGLQPTTHLIDPTDVELQNAKIIDEEFARDIILQATSKVHTLQTNPLEDPEYKTAKKETAKAASAYDYQKTTVEWVQKQSDNQKRVMYDRYKTRQHSYDVNVEFLRRRAKDLAHSRSRDAELPGFKNECERVYKQLHLVAADCEAKIARGIDVNANEKLLTKLKGQLVELQDALYSVNKPSRKEPLKSVKSYSTDKEVLDLSPAALNRTGASREDTISNKVNQLLGRPGAAPAVASHHLAVGDKDKPGVVNDNTAIVHSTQIETGVGPLKVQTTVVSVHEVNEGTHVSQIHFNKDELSRFGEDGYLKWAVTEIENFRASSLKRSDKPFKLISKSPNELPPKLIEMMVKYCRLQGYDLINTTNVENKATDRSVLDKIDKKLQQREAFFYSGKKRPQPSQRHRMEMKAESRFRPS